MSSTEKGLWLVTKTVDLIASEVISWDLWDDDNLDDQQDLFSFHNPLEDWGTELPSICRAFGSTVHQARLETGRLGGEWGYDLHAGFGKFKVRQISGPVQKCSPLCYAKTWQILAFGGRSAWQSKSYSSELLPLWRLALEAFEVKSVVVFQSGTGSYQVNLTRDSLHPQQGKK